MVGFIEVKVGNSYARNPLMANFCSKTMPYRGWCLKVTFQRKSTYKFIVSA